MDFGLYGTNCRPTSATSPWMDEALYSLSGLQSTPEDLTGVSAAVHSDLLTNSFPSHSTFSSSAWKPFIRVTLTHS